MADADNLIKGDPGDLIRRATAWLDAEDEDILLDTPAYGTTCDLVHELRDALAEAEEKIRVREARADELRDSLFGNPAIRPERRHPWEAADG